MHPIENIMRTSMAQIKEIVDVDTIIGAPIALDGESMVLPISKVSLGFLSGGGEYSANAKIRQSGKILDEQDAQEERHPFAGAAAAGMSLTPIGFLSVNGENVKVLPVTYDCYMDRVVDAIPGLVNALIEKCSKTGAQNKDQNKDTICSEG